MPACCPNLLLWTWLPGGGWFSGWSQGCLLLTIGHCARAVQKRPLNPHLAAKALQDASEHTIRISLGEVLGLIYLAFSPMYLNYDSDLGVLKSRQWLRMQCQSKTRPKEPITIEVWLSVTAWCVALTHPCKFMDLRVASISYVWRTTPAVCSHAICSILPFHLLLPHIRAPVRSPTAMAEDVPHCDCRHTLMPQMQPNHLRGAPRASVATAFFCSATNLLYSLTGDDQCGIRLWTLPIATLWKV